MEPLKITIYLVKKRIIYYKYRYLSQSWNVFHEGQVKEGTDVHTFQGGKLLVGNFVKATTDQNIAIIRMAIVRNWPLLTQFAVAREECETVTKTNFKYLSNV